MKKDELIARIQSTRKQLLDILTSIPPECREVPGATGEWSVKDVIVHLNYWGSMHVTMLFQVRQGVAPTTVHFDPALDVEALNRRWYEMGKDRPWEAAWNDFEALHRQVLRRVAEFSEAELNDPHLHPKLGGRCLWEFIATDTYQHDEEHIAPLRTWLETLPGRRG